MQLLCNNERVRLSYEPLLTYRRWRRWRASTSTTGKTRRCTLSATGNKGRSQGPIQLTKKGRFSPLFFVFFFGGEGYATSVVLPFARFIYAPLPLSFSRLKFSLCPQRKCYFTHLLFYLNHSQNHTSPLSRCKIDHSNISLFLFCSCNF